MHLNIKHSMMPSQFQVRLSPIIIIITVHIRTLTVWFHNFKHCCHHHHHHINIHVCIYMYIYANLGCFGNLHIATC